MEPIAVFDPQILAVPNREGGQVALVKQSFSAHQLDQFWPGSAQVCSGFGEGAFHSTPYAASWAEAADATK